MAVLNYVTTFLPRLVEMYGHLSCSDDLYHSNPGIEVINTKDIRIPSIKVGGYKDHNRGVLGFNTGSYSNDWITKSLDHDRDIEFAVDPMDVDETAQVVSISNIQANFERTQAIPEQDCYTFSKIYTEAKRVGANINNTVLTKENILDMLDADMEAFAEAGVPLERCILYVTPTVNRTLKNAEGIQRYLEANGGANIDRRVHSVDDINKIKEVPSDRLKTIYNFTDGCIPDAAAKQINYILIDPECQVSRMKYSYVNVFTPGHDSRTADNYLYQNRKFNGIFAIDALLKEGCRINAEAEA